MDDFIAPAGIKTRDFFILFTSRFTTELWRLPIMDHLHLRISHVISH